MDITGKKVVIVGGKRSGMALARLVQSQGAQAKISEQGDKKCLSNEFVKWAKDYDLKFEFNGHTKDFICDSDLILLSPGVPIDAQPVQWAKVNQIPVLGEVEFAVQFCNKPIIAVTGSNGKTTVSTLISQVLQKAGYQTSLCGNIGSPLSGFVTHMSEIDYVVLEISSFQLESLLDPSSSFREFLNINAFKPYIAVILNFSQNHLDRHCDLDEYFTAKKRVYMNQDSRDHLVINAADSQSENIASSAKSHVVYFNQTNNQDLKVNPNHCAVSEVARILKIDDDVCQNVFECFAGVEHRLEKVRNLNGVDFINDSKATTTQAGLWALESIDQPIVMICGGRDKNVDFTVLSEVVKGKVKQMIVIGEARKKIKKAFDALISLEECENLEEAVIKARESASQGDCVLLSPMCASFDMFQDFEERGRIFKTLVNNLK